MATQLQLRKGTKIQNDAFTGAEAELTYDTTSKGLRIHDGETVGGHEIPVLVAVQRPAAENNYTWFRVWSDGWVEQGGRVTPTTGDVTLPVEMSDTNYNLQIRLDYDNTGTIQGKYWYATKTTTGFTMGSFSTGIPLDWLVCGMAAN